MNRIALKMLFGDRSKYLMLVSAITFATLLMASSSALFSGLMMWTTSLLFNVRVPVWVADPKAELVNDNKPMRDTDVNRVRSVPGVAWAVPLYQGFTQLRMENGSFQVITLVGLDPTTLTGLDRLKFIEGKPEDLRIPNSVIVDDEVIKRLRGKAGRPVGVGEILEINDREARIVGIYKTVRSLAGGPYIFTTYDRAIGDYTPPQRKLLTFVIAGPQPGVSVKELTKRISQETGLGAYSSDEFMWQTVWWYVLYTHIPINVGMMAFIGLLVGVVISGQTFYSFIIENTRNLAALKAMGTGNLRMAGMILVQTLSTGIVGFGIGMGLVVLNGILADRSGEIPFLMTWHIPVGVLIAIVGICIFAADRGVNRIMSIDSSVVFR